jgi:hypothetical protein
LIVTRLVDRANRRTGVEIDEGRPVPLRQGEAYVLALPGVAA